MTEPKRSDIHARINDLAATHTAAEIALQVPLTASAVRKHCAGHGIVLKGVQTNQDWPTIDKAIRDGAAEPVGMHVVAERLGITRNAVAGRARRIGVQFRTRAAPGVLSAMGKKGNAVQRASRPPAPVPSARMKWGQSVSHLPIAPTFITPIEETGVVTLLELESHHCRWPIGDVQNPDFRFCGHTQAEGRPYCFKHAKRAYKRSEPAASKTEPRDNRRAA
jgi:GcrA cell cycle regulator